MASIQDMIDSIELEMRWVASETGELTKDAFLALCHAVRVNPYRAEEERLCIRDLAANLNIDVVIVRKVVSYVEGEFDPYCLKTPPLTTEAKIVFNRLLKCNDEDVRRK